MDIKREIHILIYKTTLYTITFEIVWWGLLKGR